MAGAKQKHFISTCTETEDGDIAFEIPDEILDRMGWKEGDLLDITAKEGKITIQRASDPVQPAS